MKRPRWLPRFWRARTACPGCGASVRETYWEVCGYELVRQSRAHAALHKPPL
ncbi:MAG: hypothetical protein U0R80_08755 [Nocardioidaceae bacterium]